MTFALLLHLAFSLVILASLLHSEWDSQLPGSLEFHFRESQPQKGNGEEPSLLLLLLLLGLLQPAWAQLHMASGPSPRNLKHTVIKCPSDVALQGLRRASKAEARKESPERKTKENSNCLLQKAGAMPQKDTYVVVVEQKPQWTRKLWVH